MKKTHQVNRIIAPRVPSPSIQQPGLRLLGTPRHEQLASIGLRTLHDVLDYEPVRAARMLAVVARGAISEPHLAGLVKEEFARREAAEAVSWPVSALLEVGRTEAQTFAAMGIKTIGDLAQLAKEADEIILATIEDNGFKEKPSAPAQLLPGLIGSVASSVRFTSFIRDVDLRRLTFGFDVDCLVGLPLSKSGTLAEIFMEQKCPVIHLGYMCDHRQKWINLGTHLGEVVHSVSLAPGESRNIALVNWRRRQLTALEERTTTNEQLTATFVQNRALEEIVSAVAHEHQSGQTQTEANTAATAVSFVGAGGIMGGAALAVPGAVLGGIVGSWVPALGTTIGALAGGAVGGFVGGAAGMAAGGLVYSGAQALGMIEADTEGDRSIVADVHQRISLSTSQTASAVRSLWSTAVVEDAQSEGVDVQTSNITNYNHMHALNIEYYEILQHYLARIELERVQPIIFLPFTFLKFHNLRFIRDYWDVVRLHIEDENLRNQGDSYFVNDGPPSSPDLLPVPPLPIPPAAQQPPKLKNLEIDLLWKASFGHMELKIMRGDEEIKPKEEKPGGMGNDMAGYNLGIRYKFPDIINNADEITAVNVSKGQAITTSIDVRVRVVRGQLYSGNTFLDNLAGQIIVNDKTVRAENVNQEFSWKPAGSFDLDNPPGQADYLEKKVEYDDAIAENARRQNTFDQLVQNHHWFEQRLQRLVLRRRHYFTRVMLNAIEPEEIIQLLEAVKISHEDAPNPDNGIPLNAIAHTIPIGMTAGGFVLKLKRLDKEALSRLPSSIVGNLRDTDLARLLLYADQTLRFFEEPQRKDAIAQTEHIYVPTGGLFAEAILGRANGAEYLDMERYFNWQDAPIPHQAPAIQPVGTDSRFQRSDVSVHVPEGNLQVINPVNMPDPTGLQAVLTAIQNPNIFRDMSKASELVSIVGSLSTLAGQMGQAASSMTGEAAKQALQTAASAGNAAAGLAQALMNQAASQNGSVFKTFSEQGAALNQAAKLDAARGSGNSSVNDGTPTTFPEGSIGFPLKEHAPSLQEETFRRLTDLYGTVFAGDIESPFSAPDLTAPIKEISPTLWRDLIEYQVPEDILTMLNDRGMSSLSLGNAFSALINLDYFPIRVAKLPVVDGQQLTADEFLTFIRRNLHSNLFISTTLGQFSPYAQQDEQIWFSNTPYQSVLRIDLLGPDNAAVACVESAKDHWLFHTVATPDTGTHPVSGQRMFGYWHSGSQEYTFYTRGADRATGLFDSLVSEQIFEAGSAVWATFQAGVTSFVNSHGGEARVPRAFSGRFSWVKVLGDLKASKVETYGV